MSSTSLGDKILPRQDIPIVHTGYVIRFPQLSEDLLENGLINSAMVAEHYWTYNVSDSQTCKVPTSHNYKIL
jgi:hypothetical protein